MNDTIYTRRDEVSILNYLKEQAEKLSNGRWTDFSSGDIGSVMLGLMAHLADVNNFQIDKTASELFLDTAVERTSIMSMLKLVGYEPRHYESAYALLHFKRNDEENQTTLIPAYATVSNEKDSIIYTLLEPVQIINGEGFGWAHEGQRQTINFIKEQITSEGRIYIPDYKVGFNTFQVLIPGISNNFLPRVDDVRFTDGSFAYSVHVDDYSQVYIQLPAYWNDLLSDQSTIQVTYLLTNGEAGRVGANILNQPGAGVSLLSAYSINNDLPSVGGYFPETTEELKLNVPRKVRTMDTIVTKQDLEDLVINLPEIANIKCGDYNDHWTGYKQPEDAYKCKVLAVPTNVNDTSLFEINTNEPTNTTKSMMEYIDARRLASIMMFYEDPKRLVPDIELNIYTAEHDLRANTIADNAKNFMKTVYNREYLGIGQSLYGSVIGKDLLNNFPEITYVEVQAPEYNIKVDPDEYIDMYYARFKIYVNDNLIQNEWLDESEGA